ncbi:hypothetical protein SpiGrapes_0998 [Sphaerochaeta pleomorpha str. Grapes]|uniref:FMN-binding domain-containing protein n=1 Tax=Sphaerochaeta pleomorpha (strain ATCC BAA-1885 / DSM 22778 / Grapes) TaxID=158190 RepID=G8QRP0_SPHPG|nr:FMN-binding protein [Sphaerochaeta pleomorpha]AEV28823.1 hypothetical protein SpiGrapes_0998 [Sphaerochaeta pleomorpha str. Grapes]
MFWILMIIVCAIVAVLIAGMLLDAPGRKEIAELTFSSIDFDTLQDGTYVGEFKGTKSHMRDTQVAVVVSKGIVSDVKIKKGAIDKNGKAVPLKGDQTIDQLFDSVLQKKTFDVDVISGATLTSKTHLKAMENALMQSQGK